MNDQARRAAYLAEWRRRNPIKTAQYRRRWVAANPDRNHAIKRRNFLKRMYGMTPESYDDLLDRQGGRCAICRTDEPGGKRRYLAVDHDHECCNGPTSCGRCIRGLLCNDCNQALGRLHDDPALLRRAADYVEREVLDALVEVV